ncbi:MAG: hypothetical protein HN404_18485 [Gemmatimonadetes bacterium]|nr:hypothetical protein [Gemmatimonadota bacterium]
MTASDGSAGLPPFRRDGLIRRFFIVAALSLVLGSWLAPSEAPAQLQPENWRILVLRVDFAFEATDELSTSGRGKFDLRPISEAIVDMRLPFDGPPHDRLFYEQHIDALSHYYDVVSEGRVQIEADVFPRVDSLAYTLPRPILGYGNGRTPEEIGQLWWQLIADATALAETDPDGPVFSDYDSYLFIHAGLGFETGQLNDIRSVYLSATDLASYGAPISVDGGSTTIQEAWILPEVVVANGRAGLNGILAKFFGHQLGLPGLSNFVDGLPAVGGWSLMDVGANRVGFLLWNGVLDPIFGFVPPHPIAWSKARLGWIEPLLVERDTTVSIFAGDLPSSSHPQAVTAARIQLSPTEYLLVSNRQQRGRPEFVLPEGSLAFDVETSWIDTDEVIFGRRITAAQIDTLEGRGTGPLLRIVDDAYDTFVPSSGVLVWHIDSTVFIDTPEFFNSERTRPGVMLHEADGERDIGNAYFDRQDRTEGNRADAYFAGTGIDSEPGVAKLGPSTHPSSLTHTGLDSGVEIEVLDEIGDVMRVAIRFNHSVAGWPVSLADVTRMGLAVIDGSDRPPNGGVLILSGNDQRTLGLAGSGLSVRQWSGQILAAAESRIILAQDGVVRALDPAVEDENGEEGIWHVDAEAPRGALIGTISGFADPVVALNDADGVRLLAAADGTLLATHRIDAAQMTLADLGGSGQLHLVLATAEGLYRADGDLTSLGTTPDGLTDAFSGDLDGDGADEVVNLSATGEIWIYDGSALRLAGELGEPSSGRGALGDMDGDGQLEIVVQTASDLHVFEVSDLAQPLLVANGYPVRPPAHHEVKALISGPILADLDADGAQEILLSATPGLYAYAASGEIVSGFPIPTMSTPTGAPLAVDVDGDGQIDVAVPTQLGVQLFEPGIASATSAASIAWSQAGGDAAQQSRHALTLVTQGPDTGALLPAKRAYCYPNPVSGRDPNANVRFRLAADATVKLDIYDAIGERVETMKATLAGGVEHELSWSVADYASGLYLCRLQATGDAGGRGEVTLRLAVSQ